MTTTLDWWDIATRLLLTVIAGGLVGLNREDHGQPAGLRTTLLVCLAASISMVLVNFLLMTEDHSGDSFFRIDPMRLPLGILSGMGFIGAGAILRHEGMIRGVTTAATLWFVTVMGLCFGAGQLALGLVSLALALAVLSGLKWAERRWKQQCQATLRVLAVGEGPSEQAITERLGAAGFHVASWNVSYGEQNEFVADVRWRDLPERTQSPAVLREIARQAGVLRVEWKR